MHYTLIKKPARHILVLAALFATCSVPAFAAAKINPTNAVGESQTTLKGYEKRINGHLAWMTKAGKEHELSQEFLAVYQGMQNGNYMYDIETAHKVVQELHASRKAIAPKHLLNAHDKTKSEN